MKAPEGLSPSEEEAFEGEVAIPTRLRSVVGSKHVILTHASFNDDDHTSWWCSVQGGECSADMDTNQL